MDDVERRFVLMLLGRACQLRKVAIQLHGKACCELFHNATGSVGDIVELDGFPTSFKGTLARPHVRKCPPDGRRRRTYKRVALLGMSEN
jgi:hypothetical protein